MKFDKISLDKLPLLSNFCKKLLYDDFFFSNIVEIKTSLKNIEKQIELKQQTYPKETRRILAKHFSQKYKNIESIPVENSIRNLSKENGFTVTTGHQLCAFLGPAYMVYKIVSVIKTTQELSKQYTDFAFVPIFWAASEDHDLEEVFDFTLGSEKLKPKIFQPTIAGKLKNAENSEYYSLSIKLLKELNVESSILDIFQKALLEEFNEETIFTLIHTFFGKYGVLYLDANDTRLKKILVPEIQMDVLHHSVFDVLSKRKETFKNLDIKSPINLQTLNFFYLSKSGKRLKIKKKEEGFEIEGKFFSQKKMKNIIKKSPEKFSPNVALRPIFQEKLLPNLVYIGGPSEIEYWYFIQPLFDTLFQIPFPIVGLRNMVTFLPKKIHEDLKNQGFELCDAFFPIEKTLKKKAKESKKIKILDLKKVQEKISSELNCVQTLVEKIDFTLKPFFEGEKIKTQKFFEKLEQKLLKKLASEDVKGMEILKKARESIFIQERLQERSENFFTLSKNNVDKKIASLIDHIEPFKNEMLIIKP